MPFCSNCGNKLSATAHFCSNCGIVIKTAEGQDLVQKDDTKVEIIFPTGDPLIKSESFIFYDFERYFGDIAAHSNRLSLSDKIPFDKLNAYIERFKRKILNVGYIDNLSHHLYYDDTNFGKGDIGYLISFDRNKNKLFLLAMDITGVFIFEFAHISSISWGKKFAMNISYSDDSMGKLQTVVLPILNKQFGDAIIAFYKFYFDINSKNPSMKVAKRDVATTLPLIETNISPIKPKDGAGIR